MSSELVVIAPKSIEEAKSLAQTLAGAHTLPDALKQKPADILAIVLTGAELGLAPMQAIRGVQIISGKPTLSADTMGALVKRRADVCEYLVLKHSDATRAVYEAKRKGDPSPTTMAFTIEDAQRAGLVKPNGMYSRYPAQMLRARCLSAICRAVFPDLCLGLYDPEELETNGSPPTPPPERDVTPPPAQSVQPPKTTADAKAQLSAKLAEQPKTVEGQVVASKPAPKMTIIDETTPEPPKPPPVDWWARIKAVGDMRGMTEMQVGRALRELTKKTKPSSLTEDDFKAFVRWMEDELPKEPLPPPSMPAELEEAPF
jgi:hypothetical protein